MHKNAINKVVWVKISAISPKKWGIFYLKLWDFQHRGGTKIWDFSAARGDFGQKLSGHTGQKIEKRHTLWLGLFFVFAMKRKYFKRKDNKIFFVHTTIRDKESSKGRTWRKKKNSFRNVARRSDKWFKILDGDNFLEGKISSQRFFFGR